MKKFVSILVFAVICVTAFGQVQFSEPQNISSLDLENQDKSFSQGTYSKTLTLEILTSEVELYKTSQDFDVLKIEGLTTTGKAGEPTTYLKSTKIVLKKNARVTGVKLIEGNYVELKQKINLTPRPKPVIWMKDAQNDFTLRKDETIYEKDALFPGKTTSFISGQDGQNTVVYLQLYISQYNPVQKQLLLITDVRVEVSYVLENAPQKNTIGSRSDAKNIILTVPAFQAAADSLKNLHETLENVTTEVVTTDWINTNYTAAANPTQPGYATITSNPVNNNYDYDLAKKIISYLRDDAAHPNLESITILGDADKVPPAYYFYIDYYSEYDNWLCSDLFYASPDYDMVLNFEVGRLPAADLSEANHIFQKLKNWKTNLNASWFNNVQLIGGQPFNASYLHGEMSVLQAVNKGYFKGMTVGKNFKSNGKENKQTILPYFSDGNTGIIHHLGHGAGDKIMVGETEEITYTDIMNLPATQKYPVFASAACRNAGFDAELMTNCNFTHCIAEGMLRSNAGTINYWGGTRVNYGSLLPMYSNIGKLCVLGLDCMDGMMDLLFKTYSEGNLSFGQITKKAFEYYMLDYFDQNLEEDYVTIYAYILMGDPALSLLALPGGAEYNNIVYGINPLPYKWGFGKVETDPVYYQTSSVSIPLDISGETNSPAVNINICRFENSISIIEEVSMTDNTPPFSYNYTPPISSGSDELFFTRYETADFKEERLYFRTVKVDKLPPTRFELLEIQNQNNGNYDLTWTSSKDYDGQLVSYTLKEMKNPISITDSCNTFNGWESDGFSISNNGHNSNNCFASLGEGSFALLNNQFVSDIIEVNANDILKFWTHYNISTRDYVRVEISESGINDLDFKLLLELSGTNTSWTEKQIDLSAYAGKAVYIRFVHKFGDMSTGDYFIIDDIYPAASYEQVNLIENLTDTTYHVANNPVAHYYYKVKAIDDDNLSSHWTNFRSINLTVGLPEDNVNNAGILLSQNYPNPFSNKTTISFSLNEESNVNIEVFDIIGKKVKTLLNRKLQAGKHQVNWNGCSETGNRLPGGFYSYKFKAGSYRQTQKMLLID